MIQEQHIRTAMVLGEQGVDRLRSARVAVFGLGGVGGYTAEALARAGVGHLDLIDKDTIRESNINRQILALHSTVGLPKVEAARRRILDIAPDCEVRTYQTFYLPDTAEQFDFQVYDYIADAIDTVTAKLDIAVRASACGTPLISCMGTGNHLDPGALQVADIAKTTMCPLARIMRKELGKRGIRHLTVVFSTEEAVSLSPDIRVPEEPGRRAIPGSVSFVPGTAGLLMAGKIIRDIARGEH